MGNMEEVIAQSEQAARAAYGLFAAHVVLPAPTGSCRWFMGDILAAQNSRYRMPPLFISRSPGGEAGDWAVLLGGSRYVEYAHRVEKSDDREDDPAVPASVHTNVSLSVYDLSKADPDDPLAEVELQQGGHLLQFHEMFGDEPSDEIILPVQTEEEWRDTLAEQEFCLNWLRAAVQPHDSPSAA
ncbi:MAG TPA: hypothetical protein VF466_00100 [Candidatus Saccharimonadales bacterium]